MGTSQSSTGPSGKSPLVPPWADGAPQALVTPPRARLKSFRQQLGKAVLNGDVSNLKKSLGHYARSATGGAGNAVVRLGGAIKAGNFLIGLLSGNSLPTESLSVDLSKLSGISCEKAVAIIVESLVAGDGDSDKIRSAMSSALIESLDGVDAFDANIMTDDLLVNIMINYLSECIFLMIMNDAGHALNKAKNASDCIRIESEMKELIKVIVDKKLNVYLADGYQIINTAKVGEIERQVIVDVWNEWEGY